MRGLKWGCKTGFEELLYRDLSLSFKAQCLPQMEGGLCLAWCHVVEDTGLSSGMHLG